MKSLDWPKCGQCNGFGQVSTTRWSEIVKYPCPPCEGVGKVPLEPEKEPGMKYPWEVERDGSRWLKAHHVEILAKLRDEATMMHCEFKDDPVRDRPCWATTTPPDKTAEIVSAELGLPRSGPWHLPSEKPKLNRGKVESLIDGGLLMPKDQKKDYWTLSPNGKKALLAFGFQEEVAK